MSVAKRGKGTRAEHLGPERRRPQVLDAALSIADREGIRAVTMEAVASAMGVSKPVVYACFASREELLDALLAREEERLLAGVMSALPSELDLEDEDRMFREGFRALLDVVSRYPSAWQLVLAPNADPSVAKRYGQARAVVSARVAALMEIGLARSGTTDPRKLPILVELFMCAGDTAVRAMSRNPGAWTSDELGAFMGRIVLAALNAA